MYAYVLNILLGNLLNGKEKATFS